MGFFDRSVCLSIRPHPEPLGWPRVHAACDFRSPLRFEDSVQIRLLVREKREKSIVYSFIFHKLNEDPQREVARGTLAVVCVTRDNSTGQMTGVPIPKAIADKIEVAPPEILDS